MMSLNVTRVLLIHPSWPCDIHWPYEFIVTDKAALETEGKSIVQHRNGFTFGDKLIISKNHLLDAGCKCVHSAYWEASQISSTQKYWNVPKSKSAVARPLICKLCHVVRLIYAATHSVRYYQKYNAIDYCKIFARYRIQFSTFLYY